MCWIVLQCDTVCYGVLWCVAAGLKCKVPFVHEPSIGRALFLKESAPVCCSVLHCVAVYCSVLQCDAVCCSVLQYVAVCCSACRDLRSSTASSFISLFHHTFTIDSRHNPWHKHTQTYTNMHTQRQTNTNTHNHTHAHAHTHARTPAHTHTHAQTHKHTHTQFPEIFSGIRKEILEVFGFCLY